jgi:antibiotic biosynthesis monooxygenase (ABM) superfamily enzyme
MHRQEGLADTGVSVQVTARVNPGREEEYERTVSEVLAVAAGFPGHVRSDVVRADGEYGEYHVTVEFDTADHYRRWEGSVQRRESMAGLPGLLAESTEQRRFQGLDLWVVDPATPGTPPRWKIAIVTWLGIFPSVVILVCVVGLVIPPKSFLLWGNIVVTALCTLAMTYAVMPALTKLLARWLRAPGAPGRI